MVAQQGELEYGSVVTKSCTVRVQEFVTSVVEYDNSHTAELIRVLWRIMAGSKWEPSRSECKLSFKKSVVCTKNRLNVSIKPMFSTLQWNWSQEWKCSTLVKRPTLQPQVGMGPQSNSFQLSSRSLESLRKSCLSSSDRCWGVSLVPMSIMILISEYCESKWGGLDH